MATVTYTLVDTRVQADGRYELEGHLGSNYQIYTRDAEPEKRIEYLGRWFGQRFAERLRAANEKK